jgi:hypothetical protein
MIASSDIITSIADDLNRLQEKKRAKKLVFYISQRYWEADYSVISNYSFESLLHDLYEANPTLEDLKALLYQAVSTLNHKTVYTKIAQYIFKKMSSLYASNHITSSQGNELETEVIDRISENIENHEESARIKKLIFAACKQYWENDSEVINMYDLRELLLELYELYPNQKRLQKTLDKIVNSINRRNFYSFIADTIISQVSYLYNRGMRDTGSEEDSTTLIKAQRTQKDKDTDTSASSKSNLKSQSDTLEKQTMIESDESEDESIMIKQATDVMPNSVPEGQIRPWLKVASLFDLKQEIMQYTNPLKAKIILFYTIYQIDPCEQNWSVVRTCSLDDLLIKLFQQYGQDMEKIEAQLLAIVNLNIEGLAVDENSQVVNALIEIIKRFYTQK